MLLSRVNVFARFIALPHRIYIDAARVAQFEMNRVNLRETESPSKSEFFSDPSRRLIGGVVRVLNHRLRLRIDECNVVSGSKIVRAFTGTGICDSRARITEAAL